MWMLLAIVLLIYCCDKNVDSSQRVALVLFALLALAMSNRYKRN